MTITTTPSELSFNGDGSTTAFAITWKYFNTSHVVAVLRDANDLETTWVESTDYTITAAGVDSGGTLTATTAPASGETLVITLEPPYTQETNFPLGGDFPADDVEDAMDLLTQEVARLADFNDRMLRVPKTDTRSGSQLEIPIDTTRANKILAFDGNGDPTTVATSSAPGSDLSGHLVTATGSANSRTLADRFDAASIRTSLVITATSAFETDGSLLVGEGGVSPSCQVLKASANEGLLAATFSANQAGPRLNFVKSRNATVVSTGGTIVQDGDDVGKIIWSADDGGDLQTPCAEILAEIDAISGGTGPAANDMPGRIKFATTPDGGSSVVEAFRVDQAQRLSIGGTAVIDCANAGGGFPSRIQVHEPDGNRTRAAIAACYWANGAGGPSFRTWKSRSDAIGSFTIVQDDDEIGSFETYADDGVDGNTLCGEMMWTVDGSPGAGTVPTRCDIKTMTTGAPGTLTEAVRIDAAQRMILGGADSQTIGNAARLQVHGTAAASSSLGIGRWSADANGSGIILFKSRAASIGGSGAVQDGDTVGAIAGYVDDATDYLSACAAITFQIDGTPGTGDSPGRILFQTTKDTEETVTTAMIIDSSQNLLIGGNATPTSSVGNIALFNGTIPSASVTNGIVLYAEDVSASSELKVRDEGGTVTTLSPHNFSLISEGPSEEMAWSHYSERDGKAVNVDMLRLARLVEKLSGEKLVHTNG